MAEKELVLFESTDKSVSLSVPFENDTVWLNQSQMIELFQRDQSVISRHIKNVFEEKEVDEKSNMHFLHNAFSDKPVAYYSLDVIIYSNLSQWCRAYHAGCNRFSRSRRLRQRNQHRCRASGQSPLFPRFLSRDRQGFRHNDDGGIPVW